MMIGTPSDFHDRRLSPKKYRATHSSHYHLNICLILLMHVLLLLPPQYTFLCLVSRDGGDGRLVVGCVFSEDLRAQRNFSEVLTADGGRTHGSFISVDFFRGVVSPIIMLLRNSDQTRTWVDVKYCKCPHKVPRCSGPLDPIHWSATSGGVQVAA